MLKHEQHTKSQSSGRSFSYRTQNRRISARTPIYKYRATTANPVATLVKVSRLRRRSLP